MRRAAYGAAQSKPLASPAFSASTNDGAWYDAMALDMLRYDAIAIGNHEFDFVPDVLAQFVSEGFRRPGKPKYASANLDFSWAYPQRATRSTST